MYYFALMNKYGNGVIRAYYARSMSDILNRVNGLGGYFECGAYLENVSLRWLKSKGFSRNNIHTVF